MRAVIRRTNGRAQLLTYDDLTVDTRRRRVTRDNTVLHLTSRELALLTFLMENREHVVSRAHIIEAVWEHDFDTFSNVVDVYIRHLRSKVDDPFKRRLIHTVRGLGYVLRKEP